MTLYVVRNLSTPTWWVWILKHASVGRGSLVIAIFSLMVATLSIILARRATDATVRAARAAEDQAESVRDQATEAAVASMHAKESYEWSRLMLLESARNRIESQAPKPLLAFEIEEAPKLLHSLTFGSLESVEMPQIPDELGFWEHRSDIIEFIIRGALINDGSDSMRVIPQGPSFIAGRTPLSSHFIETPPLIHPNYDMHLLKPQSLALFEWHAGCTVNNWIDIANHVTGQIPVAASFICFAGSYDRSATVRLEVGSKVLLPVHGKEHTWKVERMRPMVYVNIDRDYLTDTNLLRQELTGEFWDGKHFWFKRPKS